VTYKATWHNKGILWEFSGIVSFQEINDANTQFFDDKRSSFTKYQIWDGSNIDQLLLNDNEMAHLVTSDNNVKFSLKFLKIALISKNSQVKSMYQNYIDFSKEIKTNWLFAIFDDLGSAKNWVNS